VPHGIAGRQVPCVPTAHSAAAFSIAADSSSVSTVPAKGPGLRRNGKRSADLHFPFVLN
jgi:AraC family transcriptional regulator